MASIQEGNITAGERLHIPGYYSVIHLQAYYSETAVNYSVIAVKN